MSVQQILKWNLSLLVCIFLAACSGSESDSTKVSRELETPEGHHIVEGDVGSSLLTLYFISPIDGVLNYQSFNISAAEKSDYESISGSIQAVKGKEYAFDVTIYGDEKIEAQESFGIKFENEAGESVSTIIGKIDNDDFPSVSVSKPEITELDVGTVSMIFTVSLSSPVVEDYTLSLSSVMPSALSSESKAIYPYVATPGQDYEEKVAELVFSEDESEKEVEIVVLSENIIEEDETVLLQLLDAAGENVLESIYAQGIIRSDETSQINGFQLSVKDSNRVKDIKEGTAENDSSDQWQAINFTAEVTYPENINQDQNLIISLLSKDQAVQAEIIEDSENTSYVDFLPDNEDICLNNKNNEDETCQLVIEHVLEPETEEFTITLFVRKDANREADETYALSIINDQNVNFLNLKGRVINDDSERLKLKLNDEYVDLAEFTGNKNVYIINELKTEEESPLKELTFKLDTILEEDFIIGYEIKSHIQKQPADAKDFVAESDKQLTFIKNTPSQEIVLPITLVYDDEYDGDKYIEIEFNNSDIEPLVIQIIDANFPDVRILETNGKSIVLENDEYELISESTQPVTDINNDYLEYWYTLKLEGSLVARSDIDYEVKIEGDGANRADDDHTCISADHKNQRSPASVENDHDVIFGYGDPFVEVEHGGTLRFKKGFAQTNWAVKIKNDDAIECLEMFTVTFTPRILGDDTAVDTNEAVSIKFGINDEDKANITVAGWQAFEGDINQTQNFVITSDKAVSTSFNVSLLPNPNDALACASSDLSDSQPISQSISLSPSSLEKSFPVYVMGDQTVEPSEECRLQASGYISDLVTIIYQDEYGVKKSDESKEYSSGLIVNNDILSVGIQMPDAAEPRDELSTASIGTYSWDKNIAPNVGKIAITATLQQCDEGQDCVDEDDTTLGDPSNSPANTQEIIIHYGTEVDILSASSRSTLPIDINGDAIIENTETLKVAFSRTDGVAYMNTLSEPKKSMLITSEDTLGVYLQERSNRNTCGFDNQEKSCERIFDLKFDSKNSDNALTDLKVGLKINTLVNTLNINGFFKEAEHKDAIISVKSKFNTSFSEAVINESGEIIVDVINNLEEQLPSIKIEFLHDEVVEIDEALSLDLVKNTKSYFYEIATEVGLNRIDQIVKNNDFINLTVIGSREISEPVSKMSPFTLTWPEDIDIASIDDYPVLTYKIASACTGLITLECLEEGLDYILEKDSSGSSLAESKIRLDSTNQSISMDYFQLTSTDNLVELPETIALMLQSDSPLIASIKQNNATNNTAADDIDANLDADTGVSSLKWDLVVNSEETLTVVASSVSTAIDEKCDINDSACSQTKTVTSLAFEGSVATNGPSIILDVVNSCVVDATNNNKCALASTIVGANPSEQDYSFSHANNQITLHEYKKPFINGIQNINLLVNDDDWVEEGENITLSVKPTINSNAYITKINNQNWNHTQAIVLNSDDIASVSLVRNTANSTCIFETETTFTEDSCASAFDLTLTNSIAKEVLNLNANLTRQNATTANFSFKRNLNDVTYDATLIHTVATTNSDVYESNSAFNLPIHVNGQITQSGVFSTLKVAYESDSRVEIDETLNYKLDKKTSSALYSVINNNSSYVINETIKNNDFIDLKIIGSNEQNEPSANIKPYRLDWGSVLELPVESLPSVVFNLGACAGTEALECMDAVTDYTLDTSAKAVTLPLGVQTLDVDYLTVQAIDNLVELPEVLNLVLSTDSPYIKTITNTNGTADNLADDKAITLADNMDSLSWALKINSQEKLEVRVDDLLTTLSETCGVDQGENCSVKTLGRLIVDGTVAKNGPSISLNVANICSPDANNTNRCAIETSDSSNNDSEKDYVFTTGKGTHIVHTYDETYDWNDKDIQVTVFNDDWVEVTENITLAYTGTQGSSHISSLPDDQAITLESDDTTAVSISRNDTSSCEFSSGTQFKEEECNNKTSRYDLALTHSIAKEVAMIDVALDLSNSTNTLLFRENAIDTVGFDVGASVNAVFAVPDANKKLYLPVHTQNTITTKNTVDAPNNFTSYATFNYLDDEDAEPKETLDLKLATNAGSLYTIAEGSAGVASETIIDNDSVNFWLTTASNQTATENDSNDADTNTKLTYTLHWDKTIPADIEKLQFDFKPLANKQTTATLDEDYTIKASSNLITIEDSGKRIEFDNGTTDTLAGSVNIIIEIIGDQLVEVPETISAMLSISDTYTSELAAVGADNVAVDITIPNDDLVTVTLYGVNSANEGDGAVIDTTKPFSYSIDKSIAADVPTIEVYMDASTCVSGATINCAEYIYADPIPESNDYSFGAVASTQMITVHNGHAGIETPKSATDPSTGEIIKTDVPLSFVTDDRVEAHEILTIKFNKGDNSGTANTNVAGRVFIKTLIDGELPVPSASVNALSMSTQIKNDDKIKLYITQEDTCTLAEENNEPVCNFEINWFDPAFDVQPVIDSVGSSNTAEDSLANLIISAQAKDAEADTAANKIQQRNKDVWHNESEVKNAKSAASTALTNATSAKTLAEIAIARANNAIADSESALQLTDNSLSKTVANHAKNAALAAKSAATEAQQSIVAAQDASNAALGAVSAATRAKNDAGGNRFGDWTKYDAALSAANAASVAANNATNQAKDVIVIANANTSLALDAIAEALKTAINPVVDNDTGEISLTMALAGTATNTATVVSDSDDTTTDPQDYKVEFEDISGGSTTEQGSTRVILKNSAIKMENLPRRLAINVQNDEFMEPDETMSLALSAINEADTHEYIAAFAGLNYSSTISKNDVATITVNNASASVSGTEDDTEIEFPISLSNPIAKNAPTMNLVVTPTTPDSAGKIGNMMSADSSDYGTGSLNIHTKDNSETLNFDTPLKLTIHTDNILELDELVQLGLSLTPNTGTLALTGPAQINYTIENDDAVIVNVTSATSGLESVTSNAMTYTLNSTNANVIEGEQIIASNYPTFALYHSVSSTPTATVNSDFLAPDDFYIHTRGTTQNNNQTFTQYLQVDDDTVVEKNEAVTLTFSENAATANDVTFKVNDAAINTNTLTYTINNNDYIQIDYRCDGVTCSGGALSEADTTTVKPYIMNAYETEGLDSATDLTVAFTPASVNTGDAEITHDYTLVSVQLPIGVAPNNLNTVNMRLNSAITVVNDSAIEKTETFNLVLPDSYSTVGTSFIKTSFSQTQFTITNDNFLTVNPVKVELTSNTTGQTYDLQVCKPSGEDIQGGDFELTTTLLNVQDQLGHEITSVGGLTCADIGLQSGVDATCTDSIDSKIAQIPYTLVASDIPECTGEPSTTYKTVSLFNLVGQASIQPNKWFNLEVTNIDERCDTGTASKNCIDATDVIVLNSKLSNVLDTGLTQCLKGKDKRWAVDCDQVENGSETGTVDYRKQDGQQTDKTISSDLYPDLAYTFVNGTGQPVPKKPTTGEVCVQDNNTGFIWSATVLDTGANTRIYQDLSGTAEFDDYDCGIINTVDKSWQLPSVQEIMTILDVEKLKTARDFGIRFTDAAGDWIYNLDEVIFHAEGRNTPHSANYWTSDICGTNKYFVLNFLNGELICSDDVTLTGLDEPKHSIMMLYK